MKLKIVKPISILTLLKLMFLDLNQASLSF